MLPTLIWRRFKVRISPPVHDSLRGSWVELPHAPQATGSRFKVKRLADASGGVNADSGTPTKAVGATFNPFAASVGALGGDEIRVTFPKGQGKSDKSNYYRR